MMPAPPPLEPWRAAVIGEAQTWIGTRWHHAARVKGAGVDCGQFIIACYITAGVVPHFETGDYPADWMLHRSEERYLGWVERYLDRIERARPGDVAVWRYGRTFSHGAIVVEWPRILHAYRPERGVVWGDASAGPLAHARMVDGVMVPREVLFYSIAGRL